MELMSILLLGQEAQYYIKPLELGEDEIVAMLIAKGIDLSIKR